MFKNIGIYVKEKAYEGIDSNALNPLINNLCNHAKDVFIEISSDYNHPNLKQVPDNEFVENIDLLVVFGGDGTLLGSARKFLEFNIPILGVNMGNVGFLTDVKVDNFENSIKEILSGDYVIEDRNLVSASFSNQTVYGLNEIVIHSDL